MTAASPSSTDLQTNYLDQQDKDQRGLWYQSINSKIYGAFISIAIIFLATTVFYYALLMNSQHNYQRVFELKIKQMELAEDIANYMLNAKKWESSTTTPEIITSLVETSLNRAEQLKTLQQTEKNYNAAHLTQKVIENIDAFLDTFWGTIQALRTQGIDHKTGFHGTMRDAAHALERVLNQFDVAPLMTVFEQIRVHEKSFMLAPSTQEQEAIRAHSKFLFDRLKHTPLSEETESILHPKINTYLSLQKSYAKERLEDTKSPLKTKSYADLNQISDQIDHLFESLLIPNALTHYLMMRRHEKDYLQRFDSKYVTKMNMAISQLKANTNRSQLSKKDKNLIVTHIDSYKTLFKKLVDQTVFVAKQTKLMESRTTAVQFFVTKIVRQAKLEMGEKFTLISNDLIFSIQKGLVFSAVAILLALFIVGAIISRNISTPLSRLKDAVIAIGRGEEHVSIPSPSNDEIGALAQSFNAMVKDLAQKSVALQRANNYTESILSSMTDTVIVASKLGKIKRVNRTDLLGHDPLSVCRMNITELFFLETFTSNFNKSEGDPSTETVLIHKDGGEIPVLVSIAEMNTNETDEKNIVLVIKDITPIRDARQALESARASAEAANKSKSLFVANMSHEIRTPMNAILGLTHLCLQTQTSSQQRDYLEKIFGAANSLLGIINDILDFSKIEAGKLEVESIPFHLDDVLRDVSTLITVKAHKKNVEIIFSMARGVPRSLVGDPLRLGQVLTNLANNSVKFTPQGEILLSVKQVEEKGNHVTLLFSVRDTGIGMTPEQTNRLFQAFSQADGSTTRKYGGTGLGLTISKRLVEIMQGEISVVSQPGFGSTFSFTALFELQEKVPRKALTPPQDLNGKKVLVIDDNHTCLETLRDTLESFHFEVSTCESGIKGLMEIEKRRSNNPFDVIFLDRHMPDMDGIQTLACLNAIENMPKIPIILMVPHSEQENVKRQTEQMKPSGYLSKPVHISTLFDAVMTVFGKSVLLPEEKQKKSSDNPDTQSIGGARILLVEDNEINQQVGRELLEIAGLSVQVANHGGEALEWLQHARFDLVLMDIQMPIMDGYEATQTIRKHIQYKDLPIVAMTANVMAQDLAKCWQMGMDDHVGKPINPQKLYATLNKWIKPKKGSTIETLADTTDAKREPESAALATVFPELPGIDTLAGLRRCSQNSTLFRRLLEKFKENHGLDLEKIQSALDKKDANLAQHLVHTLKGVSGNIGAMSLHALTEILETEIKDQLTLLPGSFEAPTLTEELKEQFNSIINTLHTLPPFPGDTPPKPNIPKLQDLDPTVLIDTLKQLETQIRKKRPKNCAPLLEKLFTMRLPINLETERDTLELSIKKYKFKQAEQLVENLIKEANKISKKIQ